MPNIEVTDNPGSTITVKRDLNYVYPDGLDFKPGSTLHDAIKTKILQRARQANSAIASRSDSWNKIDRVLTTYIDQSDEEIDIKDDDDRKPTSIVFPYSYAIMETILAYLVAAFFQEPIFRYEGVSPEDELGAILMEKVIDLHCNKSKVALNLHTMFRDSLAYGFGIVIPSWIKREGRRTVRKETGFFNSFRNMFTPTGFEKTTIDVTLFEGNELINIDPYISLPDPNVSIHEVQKGEYFGWLDRDNYMNLLSEEKTSDGEMFNVGYLQDVKSKQSSVFSVDKSARDQKAGGPWRTQSSVDSSVSSPLDVIYMLVNLIPKEWGLGDRIYPQKWKFALAADDVVIQATPLNLDHDLFPVAIAAPDYDGYSSTPVSRIETLYGLQGTLDWLFNTHIANVRKAINDMLIVDPYLININDVKNPGPGKIIRKRRPGWGRGSMDDAIKQLQVVDITQGHIADSTFVVNWMQKIGGADDAAMGSLRQGGPERLTAGEFEGTRSQAFSRMERLAKIIGLQSMQDIGYMFAAHTQQMMEEDLYVTTTGRWRETLSETYADSIKGGRMKATPFNILVDYDLKIRDGSVPGGSFDAVWVEIWKTIVADPALSQKFDSVKIFKYIAKNTGAKNIDEFVRISAVPDQQVVESADAGNVVNINEAIGA